MVFLSFPYLSFPLPQSPEMIEEKAVKGEDKFPFAGIISLVLSYQFSKLRHMFLF
jgi:hypothetical protein